MTETLYHLLQSTAERTPAHVAVDFAGVRMSYREFREAADQLATILLDRGVGPGRCAALCFKKSIDALLSMFAVIRTGATYVPIDPSWPADRWSMIREDADIRHWLGTDPPKGAAGLEMVLASNPAGQALPIASWREASPMTGAPMSPREDIANILFTSGSTGRPKGVRITTRSLLHFSKWAVDYFALGPADRLANHAPYNFDLSTLDIFAAVRAGATMVPVPERVKMFPYEMAKYIADQRISVWYSVPSALIMMQQRGRLAEHDMSALRHVIFAGEVMPKSALRAIARNLPHAAMTNLYGPTETNACTFHRVTADDLANDEEVPIGLPIADTRLWIVDDENRVMGQLTAAEPAPGPAGPRAGELLVAGPMVTAGYHGDSALTSHRLVPAPDGMGRAYRTGDRVHVRSDGVLMFDGRIDRMIKSRGHRIEPGEIEAALARHPGVREVAVVPLPDPVFGNRIKACVALGEGVTLAESELIAYCRERLPPYMVPDVWQFYERLPRTDREKVDLHTLAR